MKRFSKNFIIILLILVLFVGVTACGSSGELKGTYTAANSSLFSGLQFDTITFSSGNRMSMSAMGLIGTSGTYTLNGGSITFKYKEPSLFGEGDEVTRTMTFEHSGKVIYLDGYEFVKE